MGTLVGSTPDPQNNGDKLDYRGSTFTTIIKFTFATPATAITTF